MDSSFLLVMCGAAIGFFMFFTTICFMVYRKFGLCETVKPMESSSLSIVQPPPPSLPHNWIHQVFPSFHGADVRKSFLSHIVKEFKRKAIEPFIDNEIRRGEFIGPELKEAIQGSRIAIVLLSKNYASSSWCLDELVEIMKCKEDLGQTVMAIFYEVDPTDVRKQTKNFGKVFRKTCKGKGNEAIGRWRQALAQVATIAGYHSSNWDTEANMIENIVNDVSNMLINSSPSRDFDGLVGMGAHMGKIEQLLFLRPGLEQRRMIGIWGPAGIGKTTIARFLFDRHSKNFQLSVFMESIRAMSAIPFCSDSHYTKLHLQQKFMSQISNQKDIKIPHLGVVEDRLKDKKVLAILDDVYQLLQLDAIAKEIRWFGPGSWIIVTTQDLKLLQSHGITDIYKVDFPPSDEALQIFCMYAFGQNSPQDGFQELAWEVTNLAGKLPLGLRVMGSYFKRMSKQEWENALPCLRDSLHGEIEGVLKFGYDALSNNEKKIFLHLACFFNLESIEKVEHFLLRTFPYLRQGLNVLAERSLIYIDWEYIQIHNLLVQLARQIVQDQFASDPGKCQFLVNRRDFSKVYDTTDIMNVVGIDFELSELEDDGLNVNERAFEKMPNLQFLKIHGDRSEAYFPRSMNTISQKIRLLDWWLSPLTCLPSTFNAEFLVELRMIGSKLKKLWEGSQPLRNLRWMDLSLSSNLMELPDLTTATNLQELILYTCSSLVELPSSIGNATNLRKLNLSCSGLVRLPSSIGNLTKLVELNLSACSELVGLPSSIGNLTKLVELNLSACSELVELPSSIGNLDKLKNLSLRKCSNLKVIPIIINLKSLNHLDLTGCSSLKTFPEISTNIKSLKLGGTAMEEVPSSIRSWSGLDSITELHFNDTGIQELGSWIEGCSRLRLLNVSRSRELISLPQLPDSLSILDAADCESLERLDCSFRRSVSRLNFAKCFKLNQNARDLIIKTSTCGFAVLPGGEVPFYYFGARAYGSSLTVNLNEISRRTWAEYKACILLVNKDKYEADDLGSARVNCTITSPLDALTAFTSYNHCLRPALSRHLYIFGIGGEEVTFAELVFKFNRNTRTSINSFMIKECGVDKHRSSFRDGNEDGYMET